MLPTEPKSQLVMDVPLAQAVLEEVILRGCSDFSISPSARCAPLVYSLIQTHDSRLNVFYWSEERSSAFFALGRIKATGRPAAVVTTSGTAAGELLPAVMEAYYSGLPLILITADRPRSFRGTGAPQSAEQVGIYSHHVSAAFDLEEGESFSLKDWSGRGPLHLNVCFEEPKDEVCRQFQLTETLPIPDRFITSPLHFSPDPHFLAFLKNVQFPLIVVGALSPDLREVVVDFLLTFQAPVYAEAMSGIREDDRLKTLRVSRIENIWAVASEHGYPIDGILRLGTIPTGRLWRDLEHRPQIHVYSVSELPFSGLSHADVLHASLLHFLKWAVDLIPKRECSFKESWLAADQKRYDHLLHLFAEEPLAEPSLIHALSAKIPRCSKVFLGNGLPIREWDQAAVYTDRKYDVNANRGVNGIDGQLSTFLGWSTAGQENWALLGDLTVLYDLVAPWIGPQIVDRVVNVVIVNNGGGRIFSQMFSHPVFQMTHNLSFGPWAKLWNCPYERWEAIPDEISPHVQSIRLIELVTNHEATERFWHKLRLLP